MFSLRITASPVIQPAKPETLDWFLLILKYLYSYNTAARQETNNCSHFQILTLTHMHFKLELKPPERRQKKNCQGERFWNDRDRDEDTKSETEREKPLLFFNALSPVFLPFTVLWNFAMRWQLLLWLSSMGEQKNPISLIYKAKRKIAKKRRRKKKKWNWSMVGEKNTTQKKLKRDRYRETDVAKREGWNETWSRKKNWQVDC